MKCPDVHLCLHVSLRLLYVCEDSYLEVLSSFLFSAFLHSVFSFLQKLLFSVPGTAAFSLPCLFLAPPCSFSSRLSPSGDCPFIAPDVPSSFPICCLNSPRFLPTYHKKAQTCNKAEENEPLCPCPLNPAVARICLSCASYWCVRMCFCLRTVLLRIKVSIMIFQLKFPKDSNIFYPATGPLSPSGKVTET